MSTKDGSDGGMVLRKLKKRRKKDGPSQPSTTGRAATSELGHKKQHGKERLPLKKEDASSPATPACKDTGLNLKDNQGSDAVKEGQRQDQGGQDHGQRKGTTLAPEREPSKGTTLEQKLDECLLGLEGVITALEVIENIYKGQLNQAKENIENFKILIQNSRADILEGNNNQYRGQRIG
jgi:hypothetical protein